MTREVEARLRLSAKLGNMAAFDRLNRRLDDVDRKTRQVNKTQAAFARTNLAIARGLAAVPMVAIGYGVKSAITSFAELERRMIRIGITADASEEQISGATQALQNMANQYALPLDEAVAALDTLTSSGMNLEQAMSFLPSILITAQASGAATTDIANTAIKAAGALKLQAGEMQSAFDIMVAGGKAGQFELKDMAMYIPELANSFASLGYEGKEGLQSLIAVLQTLREDTGTASAAATQAQNIFGKMYTEETANKFAEFGINLRREMEAAKASGEDALSAFVRLSQEAIKGDLSKLPLLFTDQEFRLGMQSLITSQESFEKFKAAVSGAKIDGTVFADFNKVMKGTADEIQHLSNTWDKLMSSIGGAVVQSGGTDLMEGVANNLDYHSAVNRYLESQGMGWWERTGWGLTSTAEEKGLAAFHGGWRSTPLSGQGPMHASPELPSRRQDSVAGGQTEQGAPIPTFREEALYEHASRREQAARFADTPIYVPPQRLYAPGTSPREAEIASMDALNRQSGEIADELAIAMGRGADEIGEGGSRAGEAIRDGASAIADAGVAAASAISRAASELAAATSGLRAALSRPIGSLGTGSGRNLGTSMPDAGSSGPSYGGPR